MPFSNRFRAKVMGQAGFHGRAKIFQQAGVMAPRHGKRSERRSLQGALFAPIPSKAAAADVGVPSRGKADPRLGKTKAKRNPDGSNGSVNSEPAISNQPRFSGDRLATLRKLARGAA